VIWHQVVVWIIVPALAVRVAGIGIGLNTFRHE
jgi:hypothetical protein